MILRGVIQQAELQRATRAVARRLQQRFGLGIQLSLAHALDLRRLGSEAGSDIRSKTPGRFLTSTQNFFRHQTAVDSHTQRQADALIGGWPFLCVKCVIIGAQLWRSVNLPRNILHQLLIHIFRERLGNIDITGQIALSCR